MSQGYLQTTVSPPFMSRNSVYLHIKSEPSKSENCTIKTTDLSLLKGLTSTGFRTENISVDFHSMIMNIFREFTPDEIAKNKESRRQTSKILSKVY